MRQTLAVILFTDIVGSVDIKREHGQAGAAGLITRHDSLFDEAVTASEGGRVLKDTGDGFLASFTRPSEAVLTALRFQASLRDDEQLAGAVRSRIGIHLGEIGAIETAVEEEKTVGLAVDLAARLMGLGEGGQILMSRPVFDDARTFVRQHPDGGPDLEWLAHGPYLLQGIDEPLEVFEVGAHGLAPLREPPDSNKGRRAVRAGEEETLGWRPGSGLEIPARESWLLEEKLGEGGFGEVWTARHGATREVRTFKFCFEAEQVRSLKREMTLFRLLREALGDRRDIARLYDVRLDEAPYFLEMEYTPAGDITRWATTKGGIAAVPLETRLEMVAQVAEALGAAHSVGVLHKDVKPVNVLVAEDADGNPAPRLTDFGIGRLVHKDALARAGITDSGFTVAGPTVFGKTTSSSGTRMYMAPELDAGHSPSVQSDVYSLGVFLYQMVVADLNRPLGIGWERDVEDPFLREDVARCVDGDPARRFASAAMVAERIRGLADRREEHARGEAERAAAERAVAEAERGRKARRLWALAGAVLGVLLLGAAGLAWRERGRAEEETALRGVAEHALYLSTVRHAGGAIAGGGYAAGEAALLGSDPERRGWEWGYLMRLAHPELLALKGHGAGVRTVDFSADGAAVLTGSFDGTARLWDATSGATTATLAGHDAPLVEASFRPGEGMAMTASRDGTAALWEVPAGRRVATLQGHGGPLHGAAWAPDGSVLATASADGTARLWDGATGEELAVLAGHEEGLAVSLAGSRQGVLFVSFSPDSTLVATGGADGTARIWRVADGSETLVLRGHGSYLRSVRFSLDGALIVTASQDETARVWDARTGAEVAEMAGHGAEVYDAVLDTSGRRVVTAGDDGTARVWDAATGEQTAILVGHDKWVKQAWWVGEGRILTASGDGTARFWDPDTGLETAALRGHSYYLEDVVVSPDGLRVATASNDGLAKIWDAATGREPVLVPAHDLWVWSAEWSHDSRLIATASGDGTAKVWEAATGALVATLEGESSEVVHASFSPTGDLLATAGSDGVVTLWATDGWQETARLEGHQSVVLTARFSPEGDRLATASGDGYAKVWETATGRTLLNRGSGGFPVHDVAWRPDGEAIAVAVADGSARVWETANGFEAHALEGHGAPVWSVAWSPDGQRLATGADDGRARVWHVESGTVESVMAGHFDVVRSVAWGHEGRRLATGSRDGTARVWEASSGEQMLQFRDHDLWVRSVSFAPDGSALLTASGDSMFGVWRALPWSEEGEADDWDEWLAAWQSRHLAEWSGLEIVDRGPMRATMRPR